MRTYSYNVNGAQYDVTIESIQGQVAKMNVNGVLFDVDKYDIRPEAQETLNQLAKLLTEAGITAFEIDGHTDSNADDDYNQTLSENRANAVKEYLKAQGVSAEITTQGYGESRPVATNETAEGRQQNRRVEIIIPTV